MFENIRHGKSPEFAQARSIIEGYSGKPHRSHYFPNEGIQVKKCELHLDQAHRPRCGGVWGAAGFSAGQRDQAIKRKGSSRLRKDYEIGGNSQKGVTAVKYQRIAMVNGR